MNKAKLGESSRKSTFHKCVLVAGESASGSAARGRNIQGLWSTARPHGTWCNDFTLRSSSTKRYQTDPPYFHFHIVSVYLMLKREFWSVTHIIFFVTATYGMKFDLENSLNWQVNTVCSHFIKDGSPMEVMNSAAFAGNTHIHTHTHSIHTIHIELLNYIL